MLGRGHYMFMLVHENVYIVTGGAIKLTDQESFIDFFEEN